MRSRKPSHRLAAWLALFAVALNALWPMLAVAVEPAGASGIEICTASGWKHVSPDGDANSSKAGGGAPSPADLTPHCEFCSLGAGGAALPPTPGVIPLATARALTVAARPAAAPVGSQPSFSRAQPRAPPVLA